MISGVFNHNAYWTLTMTHFITQSLHQELDYLMEQKEYGDLDFAQAYEDLEQRITREYSDVENSSLINRASKVTK